MSASFLFYACAPETYDFTLNWKNGKAVSLLMPSQLADDADAIQVSLGVEGAAENIVVIGALFNFDIVFVFHIATLLPKVWV